MSAEVRFGVRGGLGLAGLVDCDDPELVPLALAQTGNPGLQFVDGAGTVVVVSHQGVEPTAELVLFLDNIPDLVTNSNLLCGLFTIKDQ